MRPVDADAIYNKAVEDQRKGEIEDWEADSIINYLDDAPTINDAEIVVRGKDCKHFVNATINANGFLICDISDMEIAPDDFCSYGEAE